MGRLLGEAILPFLSQVSLLCKDQLSKGKDLFIGKQILSFKYRLNFGQAPPSGEAHMRLQKLFLFVKAVKDDCIPTHCKLCFLYVVLGAAVALLLNYWPAQLVYGI